MGGARMRAEEEERFVRDGGVEKIKKEKGKREKRKRKMVVYSLRPKVSVAMVFVLAKFLQVLLGLQ
jgi:hypothetical protein